MSNHYQRCSTVSVLILVVTYISVSPWNIIIHSTPPPGYGNNNSLSQGYLQFAHVTKCANGSSTLCYQGNLMTTHSLTLPAPIPFWKNYRNPCFYDRQAIARCFLYVFNLSPQKSGTSDLFLTLNKHKYIVAPLEKEPQYWDRGGHKNKIYQPQYRYPQTILQYLNNFNNTVNTIQNITAVNNPYHHPSITLDFSATTIYDRLIWREWPGNKGKKQPKIGPPQLIKHLLPNARFVVILRNPVTRLYSDWCYFYDRHGNKSTFLHSEMKKGIQWFSQCINSKKPYRACLFDRPNDFQIKRKWKGLIETHYSPVIRLREGLYIDLINEWLKVFPREQFYFTTLERYSVEKAAVVNEIFTFLGLETMSNVSLSTSKIINARPKKAKSGKMLPETVKMLTRFYSPYNKRLAKMLNSDMYLWNN